jgi:transposase
MPPARFVRLTEQEGARLREIEQSPHFKPKVRLRAQVIRLSARGERVGSIASYTGRSEASVLRDLARWQERGVEGLDDGTAPGNPPRITEPMRAFMKERLSEERTWNARQLAEALKEEFGLVVTPEAVRQHLLSMGYSWKRTRYVCSREPNPEEESKATEELEDLKRGPRKAK